VVWVKKREPYLEMTRICAIFAKRLVVELLKLLSDCVDIGHGGSSMKGKGTLKG
jgi:hypothetical protein